ncbi:hypothetical protein Tco_0003918 [Tanacetum coccineum]
MSNSNTNLQTQTSSVLQNDTVSSCSISKVQEKTQLSRIKCMNSLRAIQSQLKFLIETLQDFGNMHIFKRTFSQDLDLLENHLTKEIISQTDCKTTLTKLRTTFENAFNSELKARMQNYTRYDAQSFYDAMIFNMDSLGKYMLELILHQQRTPQLLKQKKLMQTQEDHSNPIPALNVDSLKVDLVVIQNTCSEKEDSNSETASSKLVKECSLNSETKDVHAIKYKMSKAKERCMAYFRSLHSHLQVLSKDDLKGTHIEHGFRRAFMSIFGQDVDTFTRTMLLNVDQLQKQLDKDEFQEDGSMTAFWVVNNQFQKFIDSKFTLDYDSQMTDTYFVEYTGLEVQHFRDTLLQHLGNVKKSVAERTRHQRQYERRVNKRQMQTQESKIDTGKALDADLVDTESIRTDSTVQDDSSRSGNDTDADDADIRPIYDEEPMAEVQLTAECNIFAIGQQHTEQPEIIVEVKCVFNANHDACITKLLKEVNSRAKIQSHKTRNSNKPVDQKSHTQKPGRQIFTGYRFSLNKTFAVYEKTYPRSDLRWKPTGRIFKSVGLRWIPTGKLFDSCTSKVDSEPPHGSNVDIPNIHECKQTLDVSAGTSNLSAGTSFNPKKEELRIMSVLTPVHNVQQRYLNKTVSVPVHKVRMVPQVAETITTSNELELLYSPMFRELLNGTSHVVSKSSDVHAADNIDKRQQHNTNSTLLQQPMLQDPPTLKHHSTNQTLTQVQCQLHMRTLFQAETNQKMPQFETCIYKIFSHVEQESARKRWRDVYVRTPPRSRYRTKNNKEAMAVLHDRWIDSMREELHQLID